MKIMKIYEIAASWDRVKVSIGARPRWHSRANLGPVKLMKSHELLTTYESHENEFPSLLFDQQNTRLSNSRLAQKNPPIHPTIDSSSAGWVGGRGGSL